MLVKGKKEFTSFLPNNWLLDVKYKAVFVFLHFYFNYLI